MNKAQSNGLVIGIDATNLRRGGGVTHLIELLIAAEPEKSGIARVVVFGGRQTLAKLPKRAWLEKINPPDLDKGLLRRTFWQRFKLAGGARVAGCDVLFAPGGSYSANFHPVVTMSRNMLPFEWAELRRYGWSLLALKLLLLRWVQSQSFRGADGVIFLTEYARRGVLRVTGPLSAATTIIPHGLNSRFQIAPRAQRPVSEYSHAKPYRVLYVSIIDQYKHQWQVVEAVAALRQEGFPVALDLVGPAYPAALARLQETLARLDPEGSWVRYHGAIPFEALHRHYADADAGLFASSCENMPNILLETMASGLPVACSNRGPMPEVLGDAGVYFDPEQPRDIARALRELIATPQLRTEMAQASHRRAQQFSWQRCADETFGFLVGVTQRQKGILMFDKKTLLITGGTGSFGNAVLRRFLGSDLREIRILSRDEKKQDDMRKKYNNPKLKFYIGDVRDYQSVLNAVRGVDFVYHAAALKQVPSCEFHPLEAVKTNVLGTENVLEAAITCGVKRVVCLSTDKAVYPINAMGISKAMMEKVIVAKSRSSNSTVICATRYGNVMASRGSVIPLFVDQIRAGKSITITDPHMTRFMMTLDDAVDLALYAFEHGNPGEIFVQKAPAATIETLTHALTDLMGVPGHEVRIIGTRHGEKLYEALLSREEMVAAEDLGGYYRVPPDLRDLNYGKFVEQGETKISEAIDYNSHNTTRLDVPGMQALLMKLKFMQAITRGEYVEPEE